MLITDDLINQLLEQHSSSVQTVVVTQPQGQIPEEEEESQQ